MKPVRAAIYARVSTASGQDVGLQIDELRDVANQRNYAVSEFVDEGISGAKGERERPGLERLMSAVRSGKVDVVMVWRFDRFARSTSHLLSALDEFQTLGVDFISLRENIDTSTSLGKAVFTICSAVAELERGLLIERVRAGVARARANGTKFGRPRHELDLRAAQVLIQQGHSVREVSDMLALPRTTLRRRLREADQSKSVDGGPKPHLDVDP